MTIVDRLRRLWRDDGEQPYEPIEDETIEGEGHDGLASRKTTFSYLEYGIFLLLGVSMLWAWNMFLAAGPYFENRFRKNNWMMENFQAAEVSVSTVTNLASMLALTRMQANASYPRRIISSLLINMIIFALLALSTGFDTTPAVYFGFLMVMIFSTSLATGLCQNGIFAYVSGFGEPKYTQGIMTGQAVAGVLPCIAQIVSVLSVKTPGDRSAARSGDMQSSDPPPSVPPTAALAYFLTATVIAAVTLLAFLFLLARTRHAPKMLENSTPDPPNDGEERKTIPLLYLFRKLKWLALAVFVTFSITMIFPVFTQRILSVRPVKDQPQFLQPPSFIPLAFLFWNVGDLLGRMITAVPSLSLVLRPRVVFGLSLSRLAFVGMYHLCNIRGQGAIVESDFFYLVVVQLFFGLSNGYLGSTCMIGAGEWVELEEREAAGGFMGLCLVAGLAVGSLASFFAAGV